MYFGRASPKPSFGMIGTNYDRTSNIRRLFSATFSGIKTALCPVKAGQMNFGRVSPKPVLGMIEFPQFIQTMIRQVICADLSAFSRFYWFR